MSPWKKSLWWNHGASTLGQATVWDTFVLYSNSLAINGKIYIHQLKNKIFGRYQPDSPWLIMVFLWFSHGFPTVFPLFLGPMAAMALSFAACLVPHQVTTRCFIRTCRGVSLRPWRSPERPLQYSAAKRTLGKWGTERNGVIGWGGPTMWGPQDSVQLVFIAPISLWFMDNSSYWGESKPTYILGASHCRKPGWKP